VASTKPATDATDDFLSGKIQSAPAVSATPHIADATDDFLSGNGPVEPPAPEPTPRHVVPG
jgi:hypothetical protein